MYIKAQIILLPIQTLGKFIHTSLFHQLMNEYLAVDSGG